MYMACHKLDLGYTYLRKWGWTHALADASEITQNISAWGLYASRVYTPGVELDAVVM